ncbi:MAG: SPOR domain-containing protein [Rhodoferax sp.]|nr:SPOR domain-containing protein [Rhodoferax sp.]
MAFFKFRKQGDEQSQAPSQPESVESMRKRAKYRLIGAAVLVLAGVIGFPMLFDQQPRPIAVDMPIDIPDRNKVTPLTIPAPAAVVSPLIASPGKPEVLPAPVVAASVPAKIPEPDKQKAPVEVPAEKSVGVQPKSDLKSGEKLAISPVPAPRRAAAAEESTKARALLEGREPAVEAPAAASRYVVQVGAFADAVRAREVRVKMERAGLKTYTHVAETKDGPRVRVRVGPFDTKAEADSAAEKIKKLDLPAAVLTL